MVWMVTLEDHSLVWEKPKFHLSVETDSKDVHYVMVKLLGIFSSFFPAQTSMNRHVLLNKLIILAYEC